MIALKALVRRCASVVVVANFQQREMIWLFVVRYAATTVCFEGLMDSKGSTVRARRADEGEAGRKSKIVPFLG